MGPAHFRYDGCGIRRPDCDLQAGSPKIPTSLPHETGKETKNKGGIAGVSDFDPSWRIWRLRKRGPRREKNNEQYGAEPGTSHVSMNLMKEAVPAHAGE